MNGGKIMIDRKILEWEWFDDAVTLKVFLYCLLKANYKDDKWRGVVVHRGQFISSYGKMAERLNMHRHTVMNHIKRLVNTGELSVKSTHRYTTITITNYDKYQAQLSTKSTTGSTTGSTTTSTQVTSTNYVSTNKEKKRVVPQGDGEMFTTKEDS